MAETPPRAVSLLWKHWNVSCDPMMYIQLNTQIVLTYIYNLGLHSLPVSIIHHDIKVSQQLILKRIFIIVISAAQYYHQYCDYCDICCS